MKTIFFMCLMVLTASSCSKEFDVTDHFDPTLSFEVTDFERAVDGDSSFEYLVNDLKHDQLLSWLEDNKHGWEPTHDTHAALVIIFQENFRLLLYRDSDFAVVRFIDGEGVEHNYLKQVDTKTCGFLE